jgi:hypothetical protein
MKQCEGRWLPDVEGYGCRRLNILHPVAQFLYKFKATGYMVGIYIRHLDQEMVGDNADL